jgi:alkyldihydroxyacetonephosphate synthase
MSAGRQAGAGPNPSAPTSVVALEGGAPGTERLGGPRVRVEDRLLERLRAGCAEVAVDEGARAEAARDWWPLTIDWALRGSVPAEPAVVARPADAAQVAAVLAACHDARVPVTPVAGRSGVCGASVPVFGGVALDLCKLHGLRSLDTTSLLAEVLPGTFGPDLEEALGAEGVTLGHWPQSMALSTVGGWLACRGAGQYSTRYGKVEDMVVGLEVALADGRTVRTGGAGPRAAAGPDLTQLFVGSEGVLGVITGATLRLHPTPPAQARRAFGFPSFAAGLEACRAVLRRGATPAVLRLYDATESARNFDQGDTSVLIVLDEADPALLEPTMVVVDEECATAGAHPLDTALVERWLGHRNDVSALAPLYRAGIVVDTIEVAARWSALAGLYDATLAALRARPGTLAVSAHQSHAYVDGACLYFTFAGRRPDDGSEGGASSGEDDGGWAERYYVGAWDAAMAAVRAAGAAVSHHHGIGLNRARFLPDALGPAFGVLRAVKEALDPRGILNPGKLGLPSPFGEVPWP